MGLRKLHFLRYKKFFQSVFLQAQKVPSWNIRSLLKKFRFPKHKKRFFWENITTFLILGLPSSICWNTRKTFLRKCNKLFQNRFFLFFLFFEFVFKSGPGSPIIHYWHHPHCNTSITFGTGGQNTMKKQ